MDPIRYGKQSIDQSDIDAVVEALASDFLTQGPRVLEFENNFFFCQFPENLFFDRGIMLEN